MDGAAIRVSASAAAGIGLLVLGLKLAADAGRMQAAGLRLPARSVLESPLVWSLLGMAAAAALHSSSAVCLAVLAWTGSGLVPARHAVAAVLGANVGTTATAQAVSRLSVPWLPAAMALGSLAALGLRKARTMAALLAAFAALLQGTQLIGQTAASLSQPWLDRVVAALGHQAGLVRPFLMGWFVTSLLQSSTVVSVAAVEFARLGLLPAAGAIGVVLGSNAGTVTTSLIGSLLMGASARRLALLDLAMNLGAGWLAVLSGPVWLPWLERLDGRPDRMVANAHTLFNLLLWMGALPWADRLGRWVARG